MTDQPNYFWHYQIGFWLVLGACLFVGGLTHLDFMVALVRNIYYPVAGFISSFVVIILMRKYKSYAIKIRWVLIILTCLLAALLCSAVVNPITFMQSGIPFSDLTTRHFVSGTFNYWLIYLVWGLGYLHLDKSVLAVEREAPKAKRLMLEKSGEIVPVSLSDITHVKAAGDYVEVYAGDDCFLNRTTLTAFASHLDHPDFIRSHRSIIVNLHHVKALSPESKGEYQIILKNNTTVKASRTHAQSVRERLADL